jgi:hypothetical protein
MDSESKERSHVKSIESCFLSEYSGFMLPRLQYASVKNSGGIE